MLYLPEGENSVVRVDIIFMSNCIPVFVIFDEQLTERTRINFQSRYVFSSRCLIYTLCLMALS